MFYIRLKRGRMGPSKLSTSLGEVVLLSGAKQAVTDISPFATDARLTQKRSTEPPRCQPQLCPWTHCSSVIVPVMCLVSGPGGSGGVMSAPEP